MSRSPIGLPSLGSVPEQSRCLTMLFSRFSPSFSFTGSISQDLWLWQIWKSIKRCCMRRADGAEDGFLRKPALLEAASTMDAGQLQAQGSIARLGLAAAVLRTILDPTEPHVIPESHEVPQSGQLLLHNCWEGPVKHRGQARKHSPPSLS